MVDRLRVSGDPVITEDESTGEVTGDYDVLQAGELAIRGYETVQTDANSPVSIDHASGGQNITYSVADVGFDAYAIIIRNGNGNGSGGTKIGIRPNGDNSANYNYESLSGSTSSATKYGVIDSGSGSLQFRAFCVLTPVETGNWGVLFETVRAHSNGRNGAVEGNIFGSAVGHSDVTSVEFHSFSSGNNEQYDVTVLCLAEVSP